MWQVSEGKMGVVSGDGMRLKARNDRPRPPGTYPPGLRPAAIGKSYRERRIGAGYGAGDG